MDDLGELSHKCALVILNKYTVLLISIPVPNRFFKEFSRVFPSYCYNWSNENSDFWSKECLNDGLVGDLFA